MSERDESVGFIHFGPFEVDLQGGELRRHGHTIKLQEQPFRILALLLARPGQVVGREEIREKLWPPGTFVDFEHSIATAVKKLRLALADDGEIPRYIETVHRQGYRFIAPLGVTSVEPGARTSADFVISGAPLTGAGAEVAGGSKAVRRGQTPPPPRPSWWRRWWAIALAVAALVAAGYLGDRRFSSPTQSPSGPVRLAVLPFLNLSGDPQQEYFSDGMTEALITELGRFSSLRLISRTSAMHYKGTTKTLPQIAQELNVDVIVEGSVIRSGDKVRITAQLLDAKKDQHIWAAGYERDQHDVLALQEELGRDIAREINAQLMPTSATHAHPRPPVSPEAFQSYLQGRYYYNKRTEEGVQTGLHYFEAAAQQDPNFAPAYAGIALCYLDLGDNTLPASQAMIPARKAVTRALQLDPDWAQAHSAMALLELAEWRWASAEQEFKRALELNPTDDATNLEYALFLAQAGRLDQATSQFQQALENDPLSVPLSSAAAIPAYYGGRYNDAIDQYQRALNMDPGYFRAIEGIGVALALSGNYAQAIQELEKARAIEDVPEISGFLGYVYGRWGKRAEAAQMLRNLTDRAETRFVSPADILPIPLGLNDKEEAFRLLSQACELHSDNINALRMDPIFDPIRADARFQDLERRIGLLEPGPSSSSSP
ncbi:MAG TPA: winged helix-turn-helix domain-containing protein [Terriglobia bacterium]